MRHFIHSIFFLLISLTGGVWQAMAADSFGDGLRYVFVMLHDSSQIAAIDSRDDSVAGMVDVGLIPTELETTGDLRRLAAIDGRSPRVSITSLDGGKPTMVGLDFIPTRLMVAGTDSERVVAASPAQGRLALIDVASASVRGQWAAFAPFNDLLTTPEGDKVLLAPRDGEAVTIFDMTRGQPAGEIAPPVDGLGGFQAFSRSPGGRVVYARAAARPMVAALDLRYSRPDGLVEVGDGVAKAYTNAIGITVILPDNVRRKVALLPASLKGGRTVAGEAGMNGVYSGWFDTVSFIPSTATRKAIVIDQQAGERVDDIDLGGVPGRGTVTPDGRKLYLPLIDANAVAVIDAEKRTLVRTIPLSATPSIALMAKTFGICH